MSGSLNTARKWNHTAEQEDAVGSGRRSVMRRARRQVHGRGEREAMTREKRW